MAPTVVSAPGKVLLTGGYLVLDQKYSGLVVATSSRFYSIVQDGKGEPQIVVRSPQFLNAEWIYSVDLKGTTQVHQVDESGSRNKFVQLALRGAIRLARELKGTAHVEERLAQGLEIAIVGDNDFYSQRKKLEAQGLPRTVESLESLQPFLPLDTTLAGVHKTGLGSSAALTTSLTTSLLLHLDVIDARDFTERSDNARGLALAHNLSQYVHCLAQGKVGSGFDVSSAVFGSHIYQRFDPGVLTPLMKDAEEESLATILSPFNPAWDACRTRFQLPPYIRLLLADVDAGSDTPSLVGKVLQWRGAQPEESLNLWESLKMENAKLLAAFVELTGLHDSDPEAYRRAFHTASLTPAAQWKDVGDAPVKELEVISSLYRINQVVEAIRGYMRQMGTLARVPIEPAEQTEILNSSTAVSGVVGGGVPGAGGYDAIWLLIIDAGSSAPLEEVQRVWSSNKALQITPLKARESLDRGACVENISNVQGLIEVLARPT